MARPFSLPLPEVAAAVLAAAVLAAAVLAAAVLAAAALVERGAGRTRCWSNAVLVERGRHPAPPTPCEVLARQLCRALAQIYPPRAA